MSTWCADGLVQVVADQAVDGVVQGGGEQQSLPAVGHGVQYLTDRRQEAQVGHVIRLVEHRDLDAAQVGDPLVHQIDQPPGRRDHDVDTTGERQDLRRVRHAAGDQYQRQPGDPRQGREDVGDLHGQLAGRHQDQTARLHPRRAGRPGESADHGQAEGQGLARAGTATAQHVPARQRVRDGRGLDRERFADAIRAERGDQVRRDAQVGKTAGRRVQGREVRGAGNAGFREDWPSRWLGARPGGVRSAADQRFLGARSVLAGLAGMTSQFSPAGAGDCLGTSNART